MKAPRWWVLLPAALVLSVAAPALRVLPGGDFFPDPWLLLLLFAFPTPQPEDLRRCAFWIGWLGALRAALTAVSPFACWAGLGLGLAMRREIHRRLVDLRFLTRLLVGCAAFLPQAVLDAQAARALALEIPFAIWLRVAAGGLLWAAAVRPPRWLTAEDVKVI